MNYEIVKLPEKIMAGVGIHTTNENMQAVNDIGKLWEKFWDKNVFAFIENKKNNMVYGVYMNYEDDCTQAYDFYACCEIENPKDVIGEFSVITVPESKYAKFSIRGEFDNTAAKLWKIIQESELNRKYTYDFEVYYNDGNDPGNQLLEIYVAVN